MARRAFLARAEREFTDRYYAEGATEGEDTDAFWTTRDMDSLDAPHVAVPISYDARLADFGDIAEVAELLSSGPHVGLTERIEGRFSPEPDA